MKLTLISMATSDAGYQQLVENLHSSLCQIGLGARFVTYDLPEKAAQRGTESYIDIRYSKIQVIGDHLSSGETVLFLDADVVMIRNPVRYLLHELVNNHIVAQRFAPCHYPETLGKQCVSTGFIAVKPTDLTIDLFCKAEKVENPFLCIGEQEYINAKLLTMEKYRKLSVCLLPERLFVPGYFWLTEHRDLDPYMIHYSHLFGPIEKLARMRRDGKLASDQAVRA